MEENVKQGGMGSHSRRMFSVSEVEEARIQKLADLSGIGWPEEAHSSLALGSLLKEILSEDPAVRQAIKAAVMLKLNATKPTSLASEPKASSAAEILDRATKPAKAKKPKAPASTGLEDVPPMLRASITEGATPAQDGVSDTLPPSGPFEERKLSLDEYDRLTVDERNTLTAAQHPNPFDALNEDPPARVTPMVVLAAKNTELDEFAASLLEDA